MSAASLLRIGSIMLLLSVAADVGNAAGTTAGTAISNQASVTYMAGSTPRSATSNTVTLYVAHYVVGSYTPASRTETGVDNQTVYFPVTFTNQGNRTDAFTIGFNTNAGYTVDMINDLNGNGTFDAGETVITSTGALNADAANNMLVRVQIAAGRTDNENVTIIATLTSTAVNDAGNNIVVANPGAAFTFNVSYTVQKPVLVFSATQSDVSANASRIPGANVTYTMTLDNVSTSGTGIVGNAVVTFLIDPHLHFVSASQSGALSDADGSGNGGTITWTFSAAQLAAAQAAITFTAVAQPEQVTNNGTGVASGTTVYAMTTANGTRTHVQFNDGVNTINQDNANSFSYLVGTASGAVITQGTVDGSGSPGDVVEYQYTLKNTGNATDGFDLTQANGGGSLDVAHVFSASSGGGSITVLSGVAQGATTNFYVRVTVPAGATSGQTIVRSLTATTQNASPTAPTGGSVSSTDAVTTTVTAPLVTIALTGGQSDIISGGLGGNAVPGTVMRWTVTIANAGTAVANNVSSSNTVAHLTTNTVVPTSVNIDADGDGTYELTGLTLPYSGANASASLSGGVLTITFVSVPGSGGYRRYQYNVAVQ